MELNQRLIASSKYATKCPYTMDPIGICVHNTANDATAANEINYMVNNNNQVSYHIAIDDREAIQAIPFNRNAWHAGDGGSGAGNRKYISIEICYSKSGGAKFIQAEKNAAILIAQLLKERGWGIDKVKKHQDFSGKYCPHRTLDMGWDRFLSMIKQHMSNVGTTKPVPNNPSSGTVKVGDMVTFIGGSVYASSDAATASTTKGVSTCTVTSIYKGKHPYHCVSQDGKGVYGWVDAASIGAGTSTPPAPTAIKVGSSVKITGNKYATGQSIPSWVKRKAHVVSEINGNKALLGANGGICSWVNLKDITLA